MKKVLLLAVVLSAFAFTVKEVKDLSVKYSVEDWNKKIGLIQVTIKVIDQSNIDAGTRVPLRDSLQKLNTELIDQLQKQLK